MRTNLIWFDFRGPNFLRHLRALQTNTWPLPHHRRAYSPQHNEHTTNTHTAYIRPVVPNLFAEGSQIPSYNFVREPH